MDGIKNVFDTIAKSAEETAKGRKEHLGADGLLVCDECGTPTECRVEVFGQERKVRCICKCDQARLDAEKRQKEQEQRRQRIERLRIQGFDRAEMQRWTFDTDDGQQPQVRQAMRVYADGFEGFRESGSGLLLYGSVGTGKTFAAACVANALIDRGVPVLMTNFSRIINRIQSSFEGRQEYLDSFSDFDLLIIDDLSAERQTEFVNEIVYSVIDARYRTGLPMIITTNISARDMERETDLARQRIYSRILERCHPIKVEGGDRRKKAMRDGFAEMQRRLGL